MANALVWESGESAIIHWPSLSIPLKLIFNDEFVSIHSESIEETTI